ncbi:nitrate- and nitrite sensing domain-containing protein [Rhodobacteraceae bacterium DSL-40]|uniref:methyl-accepting chemotaxis protein n=1 Tax=Amaricoccus sp. B4 TaxID=3368557 RepID=UPI000DAF1B8F
MALISRRPSLTQAMWIVATAGFAVAYIFAAIDISGDLQKRKQIEMNRELSGLTVTIGNLVHELQRERGESSGFLASGDPAFAARLSDQRKLTDAAAELFLAGGAQLIASGQQLPADYEAAKRKIAKLPDLRRQIDAVAIARTDAVSSITDLDTTLINLVPHIAETMNHAPTARAALRHSLLLAGKDLAGLERATGAAGFAVAAGNGGVFPPDVLARFNALALTQETLLDAFALTATPELATALDTMRRSSPSQEVARMRQIAASGDPDVILGVSGTAWFDTITDKINALKNVEMASAAEIRAQVDAAHASVTSGTIFHVALLLTLSALAGIMVLLITRTVAQEVHATTTRLDALSHGDIRSPVPENRIPDLAKVSEALSAFCSKECARQAAEEQEEALQRRSGKGIERVLSQVRQHDFSARLRLRDLKGVALLIGEGLNTILSTAEEVVAAQQARDEAAHCEALRAREREAELQAAAADQIASIVAACSRGDFSARIAVDGKEGVFRELSLGVNGIADAAASGLEQIRKSLAAIAKGDLTQRMNGEFHGLYAEIQTALDETLANLSRIMNDIEEQSALVARTADEIRSATDDLAMRTERQTETVQKSANATERLAETVQGNADSMDTGRELTRQLGIHAENGAKISGEAIAAMEGIESTSGEMAEIINVIDEIAFQTSLLALNASVEAARAGESGKGFSVVAAEVRLLAERSAEASKQIGELIAGNVREVQSSADKVRESGLALNRIEEATAEVITLVERVSGASQEQATGIRELGRAMTEIDTVTQSNGELVLRTAELMDNLAESGAHLFELVSMFRPGTATRRGAHGERRVAAE